MRYILLFAPLFAVVAAYQYVSHQIASGQVGVPLAAAPVTLKPFDPSSLAAPSFTLDKREIARLNGENIANQNRLFRQRMEDMNNYARNPAGWHGAPPF